MILVLHNVISAVLAIPCWVPMLIQQSFEMQFWAGVGGDCAEDAGENLGLHQFSYWKKSYVIRNHYSNARERSRVHVWSFVRVKACEQHFLSIPSCMLQWPIGWCRICSNSMGLSDSVGTNGRMVAANGVFGTLGTTYAMAPTYSEYGSLELHSPLLAWHRFASEQQEQLQFLGPHLLPPGTWLGNEDVCVVQRIYSSISSISICILENM